MKVAIFACFFILINDHLSCQDRNKDMLIQGFDYYYITNANNGLK